MKLSAAGLAAIKAHEGLRLKAYADPGSSNGLPITIGYGSTRNPDGGEWHLADEITEERAEELLRFDLQDAERAITRLVKVPLRQGQFDALVSFVFNLGEGAFADSTLLRKINAGDPSAADELLRWINNDGVPMDGLKRRRQAERAMFLEAAPIERRDSMSPFLIAAWPMLRDAIPALVRAFGDGPMTERNADAIEKVFGVVQEATGTTNVQAAIEAVKADPAVRATVTEALDREGWFLITEAGGGGISGARAFNASVTEPMRMPALWISVALLAPFYAVVSAVLFMDGWSAEIRIQVVTAVLATVGMVAAFWLGSSFGSQKKDVIKQE